MTTKDEYAAQLTGEPAYTYRHAGPVTQRAIDLLIHATWDRDTLAVAIQEWQDAQWHVPLNTKTPQPSTYSLADHLLAAQNGNRP